MSEIRKRTREIHIILSEEEFVKMKKIAESEKLGISSLIRNKMLREAPVN